MDDFEVGQPIGVGCMVHSCHSCESCVNGLEQFCPKVVWTYNSVDQDGTPTYGGYSAELVCNRKWVTSQHVIFTGLIHIKLPRPFGSAMQRFFLFLSVHLWVESGLITEVRCATGLCCGCRRICPWMQQPPCCVQGLQFTAP